MNKLDFNVPLWPVNVSHLASITVAGLRLNFCFMPCVFGWYASNSSSASSSSSVFPPPPPPPLIKKIMLQFLVLLLCLLLLRLFR